MISAGHSLDVNVAPDRRTSQWSETRWNGCWSPTDNVGLYIHCGRFRQDLDLWWAQAVAFLPDGQVAVDRSWGRTDDETCVRTGNLEVRVKDAGWISRFDGAAELTTSEALTRAPRGAAAPFVPLRWELSADPASPVWDMYSTVDTEQDFAGDMHIQQSFRTTGTLTVGEQSYRLDGVGYSDHSSGVRTFHNFAGHQFTLGVMPGWSFHAIRLFTTDGATHAPLGVVCRGDDTDLLTGAEMPDIQDASGQPKDFELVLACASGERIPLKAEILHAFPLTNTDANDNINGIDWEAEGDPVIMVECAARLTTADGDVGYAHLERSVRRSRFS